MQRMPAEVALQRIQALRAEGVAHALEEIGLAYVERVEFADANAGEVGAPIKVRRQLVEFGEREDVVVLFRHT